MVKRADAGGQRNEVTGAEVGGSVVQVRDVSGDVYVHGAESAKPQWPVLVGVVPNPAECFQHRLQADQIDAAVAGGRTAVLCQVLWGMGGVGKTQLAAHYAREARRSGEVELLVWVSATTRQAIQSAYAEAAEQVVNADPGDPERAAERFLAWLQGTTRRWLVVLDDVVDPGDARGLWPPATSMGRVVVTTRRRSAALAGEGRRVIDVGVFTPEQAQAYLVAKLAAHGHTDEPAQIRGLAQDLGFLPLALAQAAAYLIDVGLDCAEYRAQLADRSHTLETLVPAAGELPDDHRAPVAAVWSLSVEHANQLPPQGLAAGMLELASVLDPNGFPSTVLTSQPARSYLALRRTCPAEPSTGAEEEAEPVSEEDAVKALRVLHRMSLLDHTPTTPHRQVRVHGLVQRATRENTPAPWRDTVHRCCADVLVEVWPEVERDTDLAQVLRANAAALIAHVDASLWSPDAHLLLFRMGRSLGEAGLVSAALDHFRTLHTTALHHLGPDHPDTLFTRSNLAGWRGEAGDAAGAVAAFERLLADHLRVLGPDHPDTLTTGSNLASWRGEAGDAAGAVAAFEQLLADHLRVLGPDHPDTLTTGSNLASWRGEAGDAAGAVAAFEQLLADHLRVLGPDHPHTLTTRSNLARWRGWAGDAAGAVAAYEHLLADQLRVLGPDHPDTLTTGSNLASWRGEAGDAAGAVAAFEQLLADHLRVLGPDHPDTLTTGSNLASWRGWAGDAAGAVAAFEQLLADRLRVLGPDHPHTLTTRSNLAHWRGEAGDAAGAAAALERLLADRLRVLGPDHPHTLTTRSNLARWRGWAGDAAGAVAAFEQLLADRLRVLGPDHPHTLTTRSNLARWRGWAGDAAGAVAAFEQLLADQLRVLGPDHPHTLTTRSNLAHWRGEAGDAAGAAAALEQLLADHLRVLGPDHPHTLTTRSNLAHWRGEAGDAAGAAAAFEQLLADQLRVLNSDHPSTLLTRDNLAHWRERAGEGEPPSGAAPIAD
ncbi:tetratricopeptide repeat protein [Allonocardiopsis opalescens]|uniref:Tetratricopeptide repeat protein n=1 Tax=Allonocardiopsis opalescens TaxID=1144618 RepID=A0A2T0QAX1_9ACTN|nr:tetratricopeptide repeat protein [Allonocardiopsis opalescens]PRY01004.1 tetratricopeptide repeat protein [Allonocardiopsis opalescens]